jgi:ATP-dependent helicase HrpA
VVDDAGAVLAAGKDLAALQEELAPAVQQTISHASREVERHGLREFPAEGVPRVVEETHGEHVVQGWPALVDAGDAVDLRVLVTRTEQLVAHREGVRRLLRLQTPTPVRYVVGVLEMREKIALGHTPHGSVPALIEDAMGACLDAAVARAAATKADGFADGLPWTAMAYDLALHAAQDRLGDELLRAVRLAAQVLELSTEVRTRLPGITSPKLAGMRVDVAAQVDALLPDGFITEAGLDRLPDLVRYLRAVVRRLDTAPEDTGRDRLRQEQVEAVLADWDEVLAALHPAQRRTRQAQDVRWMIEELRVNLFAQNLGTKHPVSDKRIRKALDALLDS